jgi:hypothetical protein
VAAISDDLAARVFAGATDPSEPLRSPAGVALTPGLSAPVSMIMLRYPDPGTAGKIASKDALKSKKDAEASLVQVELVIWADRDGRRHVADPSHGVKAWAKSDLISWELFGPVVGALAGALGGGGVHSFVTDAVVTGIGWAVFGLVAGALYGLWAGRAVSARRLKRLSPFIAPGTSMIVAWAGGPAGQDAIGALSAPGSQRLILADPATRLAIVLTRDVLPNTMVRRSAATAGRRPPARRRLRPG